jgi:hypothetical protein
MNATDVALMLSPIVIASGMGRVWAVARLWLVALI